MVRKQLLRAHEHSTESLLGKVKSESDQNKLSLNITYYPVFNSQKIVYLLKCRICGEAPYVGKAKSKFRARFRNYKNGHRSHIKKKSSITTTFLWALWPTKSQWDWRFAVDINWTMWNTRTAEIEGNILAKQA